MHQVFKLKNDQDFNIAQNNHDYDFFHNRAALDCMQHKNINEHNFKSRTVYRPLQIIIVKQ